MTQNNSNNLSKTAFLFSIIVAIVVGIFFLITGKTNSFQIINGNHSVLFDLFFRYITFLGDGTIWIPIVVYCFFYKRKYLSTVFLGFLISTLLTHFFKRIIFPDEFRPIVFLAKDFPIHIVKGVKMYRINSFPSGHTATAFTIAILLSSFTKNKATIFFFVFLAFLVGYSRVYLGQHFVTDIWFGICIGIISAFISVFYKKFYKVIVTEIK